MKMTSRFDRAIRPLCAVALSLATLVSTSVLAQTTLVTAGAAEVRGFLPRTSVIVYAASYGGGLFNSANGGQTWTRIALPNGVRYATSIAGGTSGYFVVGAEEGLIVTPDGTTFTQKLFDPVSAVCTSGSNVIAGVRGLGIMRSTDSGTNFAPANNSGFDSLDITAVACSGSTMFASARPDGNGNRGGVFKSTDSGATWSALGGLPAGNNYVTSLAVDGSGTVYAGVLRADSGGDVYYRGTAASAWSEACSAPCPTFFGVVSLHHDVNNASRIWVGSRANGLLLGSTTTWSYSFNGAPTSNLFFTGVTAATTLPGSTTVLKALKGAGVWRSTANPPAANTDWTRVSFPGADRVLSATGDTSNAGALALGLYAGGVWRRTTAVAPFVGATVTGAQADFAFANYMQSVNPFVSVWDLSASLTTANLIYAVAGGNGMFYFNDGAGVFRFDGTAWHGIGNNAPTGSPWNGVVEPGVLPIYSPQVYGVTVDRSNDQSVYLGIFQNNGVFHRSSGSWSQVAGLPNTGLTQIRSVVQSIAASTTLLALPFDNKPIISLNSGATWTEVGVSQAGFERLRFYSAAPHPSNANLWVGGTNKGVFYSTDGGNNWTRAALTPFLRQAVPAVGFRSNGNAYAADFDGNRYCSTNGGVTWSVMTGKLNAGVNAIKTIGGSIYYLTDGAGAYQETGSTCP